MVLEITKRYRAPFGSDPLKGEIARRLRYVREKRGLDQARAAKQLGVKLELYDLLEHGRCALTSTLCKRLVDWFSCKRSYVDEPYNPARKAQVGQGWWKVSFHAPPDLLNKMRNKADQLYMTLDELTQLAVECFVTNEATIHTFKRAADQMRRTRVAQMLKAEPALQELLECDLELAVELGAKVNLDKATTAKIEEPPRVVLENYLKEETITLDKESEDASWEEL